MLPTYYRGCWHVVSRSLFIKYRHFSSLIKEVYNPKTFILHAALLRQGCPHCAISPTAASRRSLGRVSVPMWPFILSDRLLIIALVGRYPSNKLIRRKPLLQRKLRRASLSSYCHAATGTHSVLAAVSSCCPHLKGRLLTRYSPVCHSIS